ncbi:MAG: phosphoenolpyruvate carboxykinase (ATP) [Actinobacteria bacterium]|nr:phosphoenolpyruvate carboxykinase (ATP) [Actinomycetota bacterium]
MITTTTPRGSTGLEEHGIRAEGRVHWQPTTSMLYEHALEAGGARLAEGGPLVVDTGQHTGRSPKDKFVVREPGSETRIWWSEANQEISEESFEGLREKVVSHLGSRDLYVVDALAGADPAHRLAVRVVTDSAWHALFAKTLFIDPSEEELREYDPQALVLHAPTLDAIPAQDGTRSSTFVLLHPSRCEVLIGGTEYAGEIKKSIFTLMNDRLPLQDVLPMHCSANLGDDGTVAIFFGLSGTGKTTLSADPERHLIGDDEHGWGDSGVFNIEGGCYAKAIRLSPETEPQIYAAVGSFGTVLENVVVDERGCLDLDDPAKTENTRAAYKLEQIGNALPDKRAGHPSSIVMLTADAFGILPPIARLTRDQAMFYFLAGYTAKVAGTEIGVHEPQATFSACFGAPFLPQPPGVYAGMLGEKLDTHDVTAWLVNTGWTGGAYGEGTRMPIVATRALLHAALSGGLREVAYRTDDVFGFEVPTEVPGVEARLLDPRSTWRDPAAYDVKARELARMFQENFANVASEGDGRIAAARPLV